MARGPRDEDRGGKTRGKVRGGTARCAARAISDAAARSDSYEYLTIDAHFHLALLQLTGNGRLVALVAELRRQTRLVGLATLSHTVELEISANEHHEWLDLLAEGRGEEAEILIHTHIGHVIGWWAGLAEEGVPSLR